MAKAEIYTVSKINQLIKENLEVNFGNIWIEGEISNLRIPSTGHLYLTLKDELSSEPSAEVYGLISKMASA